MLAGVPWMPELFSAPVRQRLLDQRRTEHLTSVRYFEGLLAGEIDALVGSFAGEPVLHDPRRGRIRGARAFADFVTETNAGLAARDVSVEEVGLLLTPERGVEEVVLHLDGGRTTLPMAMATEHARDGRIVELRIYFSSVPLTGRHAIRPPLLQPDPELHLAGVVADHQHALAAGDTEAAIAAFETGGSLREAAGTLIHQGTDALRAHYERLFAHGGGIALEHCTATDDGVACGLEYNLVGRGATAVPPQAGIAVYVRGATGKLAAARIYDDADPTI
jgi:hypothetical protein